MADKTAVAAGAGLGIGALLAYVLAHPSAAKAAPAPEGMDQETWSLIISIIESIQEQNARMEGILSSLTSLLSGGSIGLKNPKTFNTGQVLCPAAMPNAYPIPFKNIPYDKEFVVKAISGNLGIIYVANNQGDAGNIAASYPLLGNEAVGLKIENSEGIWISAQFAGEGVNWIVEQG